MCGEPIILRFLGANKFATAGSVFKWGPYLNTKFQMYKSLMTESQRLGTLLVLRDLPQLRSGNPILAGLASEPLLA